MRYQFTVTVGAGCDRVKIRHYQIPRHASTSLSSQHSKTPGSDGNSLLLGVQDRANETRVEGTAECDGRSLWSAETHNEFDKTVL